MGNLLLDSNAVDVAAIIVSGFLSIVVIVVSIVTAWFNDRTQKNIAKANQESASISRDAATLPFKVEIVDNLIEYDKDFYNACTKLMLNQNPTDSHIENVAKKIDEMLSSLYAIELKVGAVLTVEDSFYNEVKKLYEESETLYINYLDCINVLKNDLIQAHATRKTLDQLANCKKIVGDILDNPGNFSIFTCKMNKKSVDYIKQYLVVYHLLENLHYQEIMNHFVGN